MCTSSRSLAVRFMRRFYNEHQDPTHDYASDPDH